VHSQPKTLRLTLAVALAVAMFTVAACGGSNSSGGSSSGGGSGSGSSDAQDTARVRLNDCLRKQGIEVPSNPGAGGGGGGPRNIDRNAIQKALQGPCKKYQQKAFGNVSRQDQSELRDRLTKFTSCLRQHGVDVADFDPSSGAAPPQIDQNDPAVKKATQACRSKLPQGGPGGPGQ
jgi:hypothetical protein